MCGREVNLSCSEGSGYRCTSHAWLLSGALALAVSFPSFSLYPLAWIATIPLLLRLVESQSPGPVFSGHFLFFLSFFGLVLYWVPAVMINYGGLHPAVALGVFALLLGAMSLLMLPFSILTWGLARAFNDNCALFAAPALWTSCELLRERFLLGGFPWASVGYSQHGFGVLLQVADLGGVYLLSFLVLSGASATLLWIARGKRSLALVYMVLILLSVLYGAYRLWFWKIETEHWHRATLVQPGIALRGSRAYFQETYFQQLGRTYSRACEEGTEWVIFPETPNPFSPDLDAHFRTFWSTLVAEKQRPLVLSATGQGTHAGLYYNSAFLFDRSGSIIHRYDKRHLVPFGEYLPAGATLLGLSEALVGEVGQFSPGRSSQRTAHLDDEQLGFLICYESIFPELSRQAVLSGARFLVNTTNDMWFGDTAAPWQHLQMAALRAVEVRKPLLRAANSGITAWVDSWGRIRGQLGLLEVGRLEVEFKPNSYRSLYTQLGLVPLALIIMMVISAAVAGGMLARRKETSRGKLSS